MTEKKFRFCLLLAFLFLAGIGLDSDIGGLARLDYTLETARDTILHSSVLLIIWLPLIYLGYRLTKKLTVSPYILPLAIFGGITISGFLGTAGNNLIDIVNSQYITDPVFFNEWTDAFTAPFAEEFFKAVVAFLVVGILGFKDIRSIFIAGLGAGIGFQIIEDLSFVIYDTAYGSVGLSTAIDRIAGGIGSHSAYTAAVAVGAYILLSNQYRKNHILGAWFVCGTVLNHFLWNSPFAITDRDANILSAALFTLSVLLFVQSYLFVLKSKDLASDQKLSIWDTLPV